MLGFKFCSWSSCFALQTLPRFQPENIEHNNILFERVKEIATRKGCATSQLALAWVHHQGDDMCPIPGTTKIGNLDQNIGALSLTLTPEEMAELESIASAVAIKGDRFQGTSLTWKASDTPLLASWKAWRTLIYNEWLIVLVFVWSVQKLCRVPKPCCIRECISDKGSVFFWFPEDQNGKVLSLGDVWKPIESLKELP